MLRFLFESKRNPLPTIPDCKFTIPQSINPNKNRPPQAIPKSMCKSWGIEPLSTQPLPPRGVVILTQ